MTPNRGHVPYDCGLMVSSGTATTILPAAVSMSSSRRIFAGVCALLLSLCALSAKGTLTVTFDGPPLQPPGTASLLRFYDESGVWFTPIQGTDGFVCRGSNHTPGWPDDGTAYV